MFHISTGKSSKYVLKNPRKCILRKYSLEVMWSFVFWKHVKIFWQCDDKIGSPFFHTLNGFGPKNLNIYCLGPKNSVIFHFGFHFWMNSIFFSSLSSYECEGTNIKLSVRLCAFDVFFVPDTKRLFPFMDLWDKTKLWLN